MSEAIIAVHDADFDQIVLKSPKPVLVDFWAAWCGPCRVMMPIIETLAEDEAFKEKILFVKMDIDQNPNTPAKYHIMSIPTFIIFKGGEVVNKQIGSLDKAALKTFVASCLL